MCPKNKNHFVGAKQTNDKSKTRMTMTKQNRSDNIKQRESRAREREKEVEEEDERCFSSQLTRHKKRKRKRKRGSSFVPTHRNVERRIGHYTRQRNQHRIARCTVAVVCSFGVRSLIVVVQTCLRQQSNKLRVIHFCSVCCLFFIF